MQAAASGATLNGTNDKEKDKDKDKEKDHEMDKDQEKKMETDNATVAGTFNESKGIRLVATFKHAAGCIWSVAFSPDGNHLATGSCDGKARLYARGPRFALVATLTDAGDEVGSVAFWKHKGGPLLLGAGSLDSHWRLYNATDLAKPILLAAREEEGWEVDGFAFSADSPIFSVVSAGGNTQLYSIMDPAMPELMGEVKSNGRTACTTALMPHGARMAIGYLDGTLKTMSTTEDGLQEAGEKNLTATVINVAYSPDNRLLAAASADGTATLFDNLMERNEQGDPLPMRQLWRIGDATDKLNSVAFSPDSKLLATGSWDNKTRIYDISTPELPRLMATLGDAKGRIYSVALAQHTTFDFLATGSQDGATRLYRIPRKSKKADLP